jgi:hypothetical protein
MKSFNDFLQRYKYKLGPVFIDGWRIVEREGDCDDFALTAAYHLADDSILKLIWNILIFKTVFWLVKSPRNGFVPRHTILYQRGLGYIDSSVNNEQFVVSPKPNKLIFPWLFPIVFFFMIQGKIYQIFKG